MKQNSDEHDESDEESKEIDSKPKKLPKIIINTSKTRSEHKLIQQLVEKYNKFGWGTATGWKGDVLWAGLDIPMEDYNLAKEIRVNRIPGIKELAHKKETGFYLNKFREYFPEDFTFFPKIL